LAASGVVVAAVAAEVWLGWRLPFVVLMESPAGHVGGTGMSGARHVPGQYLSMDEGSTHLRTSQTILASLSPLNKPLPASPDRRGQKRWI